MEYLTKVNGWKEEEKDSVFKSGPMDPSTMDSGKTIRLMDRAPYTMLMVMYMKVNGSMIKPVDKEHILMKMVPSTLVNGKTINKMDMVLNNG